MDENRAESLSDSNYECNENEIEIYTTSSTHGSSSDDSGDTKKSLINLGNAENLDYNKNRINRTNHRKFCFYYSIYGQTTILGKTNSKVD